MIKIVLILVIGLIGGAAGLGAGMFLRPEAEVAAPEADAEGAMAAEAGADGDADQGDETYPAEEKEYDGDADSEGDGTTEIVKMNNQFVVPVVEGDRVAAMVVLSLSLETKPGGQVIAYAREPKLRDAFLQVLFDHANTGGFNGNFTGGDRLETLKKMLRGATRSTMGNSVVNVLITDIARQDR